jgi:hypothetical protein
MPPLSLSSCRSGGAGLLAVTSHCRHHAAQECEAHRPQVLFPSQDQARIGTTKVVSQWQRARRLVLVEAVAVGISGGGEARVDAELGENVGDVDLYRRQADEQGIGNVLIGESRREQAQDLEFAR